MTYDYTTDKTKVDIPEWADDYSAGSEIQFKNPHTNDVESAEVIGFSILSKSQGLPVIEKTKTISSPARHIAINKKYHLNGKDDTQ